MNGKKGKIGKPYCFNDCKGELMLCSTHEGKGTLCAKRLEGNKYPAVGTEYPSTQIMISKYHFSLLGTRALCKKCSFHIWGRKMHKWSLESCHTGMQGLYWKSVSPCQKNLGSNLETNTGQRWGNLSNKKDIKYNGLEHIK